MVLFKNNRKFTEFFSFNKDYFKLIENPDIFFYQSKDLISVK